MNEFPERSPAIQDSVTHVSETQVEPALDITKSESSVLSKEKKPSKMKQMVLLMKQILDAEDNDEDEEASTAESSFQHHFDLFQDAQDPNDVTDLGLDF